MSATTTSRVAPSRSSTVPRDALCASLRAALESVRAKTLALVASLNEDEMNRQHSPLMSPLAWDLGHIANFEALWLLQNLGESSVGDSTLEKIYDPFSNPRNSRGELPMLRNEDVFGYLADVRERVLVVLERQTFPDDDTLLRAGYVYWMIIQHEAQHQETMLQALDLAEDLRPFEPAARAWTRHVAARAASAPENSSAATCDERIVIDSPRSFIGTDDRASAYDNERPRHTMTIEPFVIGKYPVTCGGYREFMEADGYKRRELWSDAGNAWRAEALAAGIMAPQGWMQRGGRWEVRRFGHWVPVRWDEPVQHVCFYEAEAFATWAGARLPTEFEWECAANGARGDDITAAPTSAEANLGAQEFRPVEIGTYGDGASASGVQQLLGDVYEWTSSTFNGYPGFESFPYREYSEVFFGDEYRVLRGASWATSPYCARKSFRNWDYPIRRQIFAGFRLAWDR